MYTCCVFFFHPSVDGYSICFHSLSVINNSTMSVHKRRSYQPSDFISSKKNLVLGSLTHIDSLLRAEAHLNPSVMTVVTYILTNYKSSLFSTYSPAFVVIILFNNSHSCWNMVVSIMVLLHTFLTVSNTKNFYLFIFVHLFVLLFKTVCLNTLYNLKWILLIWL